MTRPGKNHSIDSFYSKMHLLLQKSLKDLGQGAGHAIASNPWSASREKWAVVVIHGDHSLPRGPLQPLLHV